MATSKIKEIAESETSLNGKVILIRIGSFRALSVSQFVYGTDTFTLQQKDRGSGMTGIGMKSTSEGFYTEPLRVWADASDGEFRYQLVGSLNTANIGYHAPTNGDVLSFTMVWGID